MQREMIMEKALDVQRYTSTITRRFTSISKHLPWAAAMQRFVVLERSDQTQDGNVLRSDRRQGCNLTADHR
jgi:hypothetical protein